MPRAMDSLIAHYKMNENTSGDNAELIDNGDFARWSGDNPDGWTVESEAAPNHEISEVGTGEAHGGAGIGSCNLYTIDGSVVSLRQDVAIVIGRKYIVSIYVNKATAGTIRIADYVYEQYTSQAISSEGTHYWTFVASSTNVRFLIVRKVAALTDITFDDFSVKLLAVEDSSGNDHDALAQQDTSAISVAGKINTAFDFNGSSDYIEISDHNDFTPALTPFSISAWVNMHDATNFTIVSKGVVSVDAEWQLFFIGNDRLYFRIYDNSVGNCFIGRFHNTALISYQNTWVHIVATYDGSALSTGIRLYLNGVRIDDTTTENLTFVAVENLAAPVHIGRYSTTYANGLIDNVMFFSRELTIKDVRRLYNAGKGEEEAKWAIHSDQRGRYDDWDRARYR